MKLYSKFFIAQLFGILLVGFNRLFWSYLYIGGGIILLPLLLLLPLTFFLGFKISKRKNMRKTMYLFMFMPIIIACLTFIIPVFYYLFLTDGDVSRKLQDAIEFFIF